MNRTADEPLDDAVDMDVIAALKELGGEDDPALFDELVDTFLADTPERLAAIEAAVRAGDPEALHRAAHGLKSSAANMGARLLAELCRTLEQSGAAGSVDPEGVLPLRAAYDAAVRALLAARG